MTAAVKMGSEVRQVDGSVKSLIRIGKIVLTGSPDVFLNGFI